MFRSPARCFQVWIGTEGLQDVCGFGVREVQCFAHHGLHAAVVVVVSTTTISLNPVDQRDGESKCPSSSTFTSGCSCFTRTSFERRHLPQCQSAHLVVCGITCVVPYLCKATLCDHGHMVVPHALPEFEPTLPSGTMRRNMPGRSATRDEIQHVRACQSAVFQQPPRRDD